MFTAKQRSKKLNQALDLLEQADALIQEALGASDECYDIHNAIQDVVDDVIGAVVEVDGEVAGEYYGA